MVEKFKTVSVCDLINGRIYMVNGNPAVYQGIDVYRGQTSYEFSFTQGIRSGHSLYAIPGEKSFFDAAYSVTVPAN